MGMANRELEFAKILEGVKRKAREQGGVISKEQVEEAFSIQNLQEEQLNLVLDYLKTHKIGIGEPLSTEEELSEEEKDYLEYYLQSLEAFPVISEAEKEGILRSAFAGDGPAKEQLLYMLLPKVPDVAKLYSGQGVFLEDLIGQGNMAVSEGIKMLDAVDTPQEIEGMLIRMIMDSMEEIIQENIALLGEENKMTKKVNEIADAAKELAAEMRRSVTFKELAEETKWSEEEIRETYRLSGNAIEDIDGREETGDTISGL